jgi:hypothetical protein
VIFNHLQSELLVIMETKVDAEKQHTPPTVEALDGVGEIVHVNVSGHVQELDRNFGFWSICAISILADNAWAAGGGSLVCLSSTQVGELRKQ